MKRRHSLRNSLNLELKNTWMRGVIVLEKVIENSADVESENAWCCSSEWIISERSCYFSKFYIVRVHDFSRRDPRSSTIEERRVTSSRRTENHLTLATTIKFIENGWKHLDIFFFHGYHLNDPFKITFLGRSTSTPRSFLSRTGVQRFRATSTSEFAFRTWSS